LRIASPLDDGVIGSGPANANLISRGTRTLRVARIFSIFVIPVRRSAWVVSNGSGGLNLPRARTLK
jgi:hypothetical protein